MAHNLTTTTIVGRLASQPDMKLTASGVDVTHFRMAANERRYDRAANQWVNGDPIFMDVTCWRRLALHVKSCLEKGDPVIVRGRLYTHEYEIDGKRRSTIRLEADAVGPDLTWLTAGLQRRPRSEAKSDPAAQSEATGETAEVTAPKPPGTPELLGLTATVPDTVDELLGRPDGTSAPAVASSSAGDAGAEMPAQPGEQPPDEHREQPVGQSGDGSTEAPGDHGAQDGGHGARRSRRKEPAMAGV